MRSDIAARVRFRLNIAVNRIVLRSRKTWRSIVLSVREVPLAVAATMRSLRRMSTRRAFTVASITIAIATPTMMFLVEYNKNQTQRAAYRSLLLETTAEASFLQSSMHDLIEEQSRLTRLLLNEGHTIRQGDQMMVKVVVTGYSSSIRETDSTPFITAANTPTREGVLALSRDLLTRYTPGAPFSFGDRVEIPGVGYFIVEDSMNARWSNRADIWFSSRTDALRFGVRQVYLTATPEELGDIKSSVTVEDRSFDPAGL